MNIMPSCKDITKHASDYVDHHLQWWQRPGYWLHLVMCVHCRRYIDQLKLTIRTLGQIPEATPPEVDEQQVQAIVAQLQKPSAKIDSE